MAMETLASIAGALAQTMAPQLTRVWNRQANLLRSIPIKEYRGQGSGQLVSWDVEGDAAAAATFTEGGDITVSSESAQDNLTKASLYWGQYRSVFSMSNLEINAAASNVANATALEDMVGERFVGALTKITSVLNTDAFSGDGGTQATAPTLFGLDTVLASSGAYAGLTAGATGLTNWKSTVSSNSGTARALTMNLLAATEQGVFTLSGEEPDTLIATPGAHTKYEGLFEAVRRTVDSGQGPIPSYQGSTGRLFWRGKPIIRDKDATSGYLYMLNSNHIELVVLPWAAVPDGVQVQARSGVSSNGAQMDAIPIPVRCYPLARVGSGVSFCVEVYAQLKIDKRSTHAIISDISES